MESIIVAIILILAAIGTVAAVLADPKGKEFVIFLPFGVLNINQETKPVLLQVSVVIWASCAILLMILYSMR